MVLGHERRVWLVQQLVSENDRDRRQWCRTQRSVRQALHTRVSNLQQQHGDQQQVEKQRIDTDLWTVEQRRPCNEYGKHRTYVDPAVVLLQQELEERVANRTHADQHLVRVQLKLPFQLQQWQQLRPGFFADAQLQPVTPTKL